MRKGLFLHLLGGLAVILPAQQSALAATAAPASPRSTAICSKGDNPEPGMQGETPLADYNSTAPKPAYSCGIRIVAKVDPFGGSTSGFITRSRSCAYVHGRGPEGAGLAVVDLADQELLLRQQQPRCRSPRSRSHASQTCSLGRMEPPAAAGQ